RFNRAPCTQPYCFLCTLVYKRPPQLWRYGGQFAAAIKNIHAFIAPSLTNQVKHQQLGFKARIVHLPNFVPMPPVGSRGPDQPNRQPPATPYFLFVGRLEKLKGLQTIIPVFLRYTNAQLWIAGTGSEEQSLRQLAVGSTNIRFVGHQSNQQLNILYH